MKQSAKLEPETNADEIPASVSIAEQQNFLRKRTLSATELIATCFDEMDQKRHLNIFITETRERSLEQANESDKRIAEGKQRPLVGDQLLMLGNRQIVDHAVVGAHAVDAPGLPRPQRGSGRSQIPRHSRRSVAVGGVQRHGACADRPIATATGSAAVKFAPALRHGLSDGGR